MENAQTDSTISIIANGQSREIVVGSTLSDLLRVLNIVSTYVVVQLNGDIVPRDHYEQTVLSAGCKLEIITLVGGG